MSDIAITIIAVVVILFVRDRFSVVLVALGTSLVLWATRVLDLLTGSRRPRGSCRDLHRVAVRGQTSQLLMPLVFAAHAGSTLAFTGTPVNVLVNEAAVVMAWLFVVAVFLVPVFWRF